MPWILVAYLFALVYLTVHREKLPKSTSIRVAWFWFSLIPLSHFFFTLFRAGNYTSARDLALVEIWAEGVAWLLLGISWLRLFGNVFPQSQNYSEQEEPMSSPPPKQ
jgi:hypothetical protein